VKFTKTPASNLYGTEYQSTSAAGETSTTSLTIWSNKLTITTPVLPLGNYRIDYAFNWRASGANREADFRIQIASADVANWRPSYLRTAGRLHDSGFVIVDDVSDVQTITFDFKVGGSSTTVYTSAAFLSFYRVS
jgi:hypothetical protein